MRGRTDRLAVAAALLAAAEPATAASRHPAELAAQEQSPGAPFIGIAGQPAVYVPGAGAPAYAPPAITGLIAAAGDSYIGNGGGAAWSAGTFTATVGSGASYFGDLLPMANNRILTDASWGYGVGAQTSLGVVDRFNSTRRDPGTAAASSATIAGGSPTTLTINTATVATFGPQVPLTGTGVTGQGLIIVGQISGAAGGSGVYTIVNPNGVTFTNAAIGTTQNPAYAVTATGNDSTWSTNSTGVYSVLSDPANIVFLNNATNDYGAVNSVTVANSITNVGAELDALGPNGATIGGVFVSGANKLVVMGSAHPRGVAISKGELHTMAASVAPSYAPNAGAGTWSSDTCNGVLDDPVVVANYAAGAVSNGVNTVFTKAGTAASQPASQGTYNLTSAGVYWFNAADVAMGLKVALNYCFIDGYQQLSAGLTAILDLHYWMISNAADYVASCSDCSGTDYGKPGALYNRPWVKSADTWTAMLDPATGASGNHTYLNLPGTSFEGLHNDSYGSYLNAQVEAAALATLVPSSTPAFAYPAYNNYYIAKSGGTTATYSGTLPGVMATQIGAIHTAYPSGGQFEICYLLLCAVDNGAGGLASNGVSELDSSGSTSLTGVSGTINYSTGAWSITFTGGSAKPPVNGRIIAYGDPIETVGGVQIKTGNLMTNGQMDYANISAITASGGTLSTITNAQCNTANLGAANSNYVPAGWTLAGNSNDQTALAAGTLVMKCGYGTAPDGNPGFWVSLVGAAGATTGVTLAQNVSSPAIFINSATPDITRAYIRLTYVVGPSGHLYGAHAPQIKVTNVVTAAGDVDGTPCPTTNCTNVIGQAESYSPTISLSKLDLQQYGGTAMSRDLVTAPANSNNDLSGNVLATSGISITLSPIPGASEPVDYIVWIQNAAERISPK